MRQIKDYGSPDYPFTYNYNFYLNPTEVRILDNLYQVYSYDYKSALYFSIDEPY